MRPIEQWYFVRYRLYGNNNVIHFSTFSQYQNWDTVMEQNFGDWFEVEEVITYAM